MSVPHRSVRVLAVMSLALVLCGCVVKPPKATTTAEDPAGRDQCFANQMSIEQAVISKVLKDGSRLPSNYGQVKSLGFVDELLWCPAGGNMIWVPTEGGYMDCDVHGRYEDYQGD